MTFSARKWRTKWSRLSHVCSVNTSCPCCCRQTLVCFKCLCPYQCRIQKTLFQSVTYCVNMWVELASLVSTISTVKPCHEELHHLSDGHVIAVESQRYEYGNFSSYFVNACNKGWTPRAPGVKISQSTAAVLCGSGHLSLVPFSTGLLAFPD
jgi:hypothetical protein